MLSLAEAVAIVKRAAAVLPSPDVENVALGDAVGRVLAHDLLAPRDVPGFACSAMDGYALQRDELGNQDGAVLPEDGATLAGATEIAPLSRGACRRITTGAPLPEGADTVVMHEHTRRIEASGREPRIEFRTMPETGANVRGASDDFMSGHVVLRAGTRLQALDVAAAVALGEGLLGVRAPGAVAVLTTGDELLRAGSPWRHGLRYDSNGPLLEGLLADHGVHATDRAHVRDDADTLRRTLVAKCAVHPIVIVTGGVSAGEADHVPGVCAGLGEILFWKLRFRPGMPAMLARIGDSLVFGLPGNPVSVLATFVALVRPALAQWLGCAALDPPPSMARLDERIVKRHDRLEWRRGTFRVDAQAMARVAPHPGLSSGALRSLLESNVLVELAAERNEFEEGTLVPVRRWTLA